MKVEHILIFGAIILIAIVSAISVHVTVVAEKEAEIAEIRRVANESQNRLQGTIMVALREELRPKPYSLPTEHLAVSSGTGYRTDPMGGSEYERLHKGLDIAGVIGEPVYAVLAGKVAEHWLPPDGGRWQGHTVLGGMITLDHGKFFTIYGHLSESYVHEGDWVEEGQMIGRIGNTGISTGAHLHFELVVNPLQFLAER